MQELDCNTIHFVSINIIQLDLIHKTYKIMAIGNNPPPQIYQILGLFRLKSAQRTQDWNERERDQTKVRLSRNGVVFES